MGSNVRYVSDSRRTIAAQRNDAVVLRTLATGAITARLLDPCEVSHTALYRDGSIMTHRGSLHGKSALEVIK
jgi:hypothetical protein